MNWLRSWGWLALLAACGAAAGVGWSSWRHPSGPPLVVVGTDRVVVKDVVPGSTVSRVFRVMNRSRRLVEVASLSKGCNCLDAKMGLNPIPPGQTAEVTVSLQVPTRGREAGSSVLLNTREKDQPPLQFQLHAVTAAALAVKPESLLWRVGNGGERVRRVSVVRLDDRPLDGVTVGATPPGMSARLERMADHTIDVVLSAEDRAQSGTLLVKTDSPGRERIEIPVAIERAGLRVVPATLLIPEAAGKGAVELVGAVEASVTPVKCPPNVRVESAASAGRVRVVGTLKGPLGKERETDELVLRVDAGGKRQDLVVPVVAYR